MNSGELALPIFTQEDLRECEEEGSCCKCGACCIVFRHEIPSILGDVNSPLTVKQPGTMCPQLLRDERGRYFCLLHEHKDHPAMEACKEWRGNKEKENEYYELLTDFERMERLITDLLLYPESLHVVNETLRMDKEGSLPEYAVEEARRIAKENPIKILKHYTRINIFSIEAFKILDMDSCIINLHKLPEQILQELQLEEGHQMYDPYLQYLNSFLTRYK